MRREPQTNVAVYCPDPEERDPRAIYAMWGAAKLVNARGVFVDGSSPAGRGFWRLWAREVLADAGLLTLNGVDIDMVRTLERLANAAIDEEIQPADRTSALKFAAAQLEMQAEQLYPIPQCAERSASMFEAACMFIDVAKAEGAHDAEVLYTGQAVTLLGKLLVEDRTERLLPLALRGRKALESVRKAGRAKAKKARQNTRGIEWRNEVESRKSGTAEAAYTWIARRDGVKPGSVKKAIQRLRRRAIRD